MANQIEENIYDPKVRQSIGNFFMTICKDAPIEPYSLSSARRYFMPWNDPKLYEHVYALLTTSSLEDTLEFMFIEQRLILSEYDFIILF